MNQYEVMYVVDAALEDSARNELINRFNELVVKNGGEVERVDEWGKRRLAYAINYKTEGYYVLMYIKAPAELPRELERNLKISDQVLRYLVIRYEGELPAKREMNRPCARTPKRPPLRLPPPRLWRPSPPPAPVEAEAASAETADEEAPVSEAE